VDSHAELAYAVGRTMDPGRRSVTRTRVGRVVLVDDDEDTREMYAEALRADGFDVEPTQDADAALLAIASMHPDIVVADYSLPGTDGFELCRLLKANPETESIPVILITGYSGPTWESRAREAGAIRFLTKPLDPNGLVVALRAELTNSSGQALRAC
jgi:DNA-binding response OmpR family regulator